MVIVGNKTLKGLIEERMQNRYDYHNGYIAKICPQIVIKDKNTYFYTVKECKVTQSEYWDREKYTPDEVVNYILDASVTMLINLKKELNSDNFILVENTNNPRLINSNSISEVQILIK